jgi:predicted small metal-binding protein
MEKEKKLYGRDMGFNCSFMACGRTEEEVLKKTTEHANLLHGIEGFSQELYDKAKAAIHEGDCGYEDAEIEEMVSDECIACYKECFECADECCC